MPILSSVFGDFNASKSNQFGRKSASSCTKIKFEKAIEQSMMDYRQKLKYDNFVAMCPLFHF